MKRGPLRLRLQKQSQSGQQDNNGRISETGNKYFFVFLAKTLPFWRTTIGTLAGKPKIGNMYSEEIMLQVAHICIFFIFSVKNIFVDTLGHWIISTKDQNMQMS